ncbi:hypothetical protein [Azospirillum tabaci]|uniref:hypothetical protein n=1 Tax=Azospirillum tabaci TaxID=2752310 RepID=UPI001B3BE366|nr:hypothetical protein [Azospirillum tabaci]
MDQETKALCLDVARAVMRKQPPSGGLPLASTVGSDLADMLALELASRLAAVMPPALVRTIGEDLLEGADAIAEFVYGDAADKRKVYHLVQNGRFPAFRLGDKVCARKSIILGWIERQEEALRDA